MSETKNQKNHESPFINESDIIDTLEFYKSTMNILVNHMRATVYLNQPEMQKINLAPSDLLTHYCNISIVDTSNLLLDLRLLCLKTSSDQMNIYHSFLHLLELFFNKNKSWTIKMNEWLNMNYPLKYDDVVRHAIRGNFSTLSKKFPELEYILNEYAEMERCEWLNKYKKEIPIELLNVFTGAYHLKDLNWAEILIYELIYKTTSKDEESTIHNLLSKKTPNIYEQLILGNYENVMNSLSGWLKLVFLFACPNIISHSIYEMKIRNSFEYLGKCIYNLEWKTSLEYFMFSMCPNKYMEYILKNVTLTLDNVKYLFHIIKINRIDRFHNLIFDELMIKGQYDIILHFANKYNYIIEIEKPEEFILCCVEKCSIDDLKNYNLKENTELMNYIINIKYMKECLNNNMIDTSNINVQFVLESKYNNVCLDILIKYIKLIGKDEEIYINAMEKMVKHENLVPLKPYKHFII
ncbi:hypothetical protein TCON_0036 [Astathelohania contejeani]|uniref:Uncharacterized protein n=1 Tax=Astathelohania contejeani TaxID=164912 RepID=A0ABQ7I2V6_9MICR|nr:hypothetical protein TCON_0036 [Thelohania contejeani]